MAFFLRASKIRKCQKDIVVNPSQTQVSIKKPKLSLKKKRKLKKEKPEKKIKKSEFFL
jgi:hypothetical protein